MAGVSPSSAASRLGLVAGALSTALILVAIAIVPFLSPAWVTFEQGRAEAAAWTGFSEPDLRTVTNSILEDLVIGPPTFDVALDGRSVLSASERSHMQDVRAVFAGFFVATAAAAAILGIAFWLGGRRAAPWTRRDAWRALRIGGLGLAAGIVIAGVVVVVAFDLAFEVFHRLFFAGGTYLFDPRTDRLVQLFPEVFWSETAIAVGALALVLAIGTARLAGRRLLVIGGAG
jgi:integral membrane protein (TIGR01906 family)